MTSTMRQWTQKNSQSSSPQRKCVCHLVFLLSPPSLLPSVSSSSQRKGVCHLVFLLSPPSLLPSVSSSPQRKRVCLSIDPCDCRTCLSLSVLLCCSLKILLFFSLLLPSPSLFSFPPTGPPMKVPLCLNNRTVQDSVALLLSPPHLPTLALTNRRTRTCTN